jgi:single-stranded DNA-binding protein
MIIKTGSNNVVVSGVCPRDAEFSIVGEKGSSLTKFGIKVDENGVGDAKVTTWANCVAWNRLADIAKDIQKGDVVFACGKEVTRSYTNRDGEPKQATDIVIDFLSITKTVPREDISTTTTTASTKPTQEEIDNNSDLPF